MNRFLIPLTLLFAAATLPEVAHAASRHGNAGHAQRSSQHSASARSASKGTARKGTARKGTASKGTASKNTAKRTAPEHNTADHKAAEHNTHGTRAEASNDRARPASEASPAQRPVMRAVEFGGAQTHRSAPTASHSGAAPSNYRAKPTSRSAPSHAQRDGVQRHAAATARSHSVAAHVAAGRGRAHGRTAAWHRHYAAAHHRYAWYQPRGWFHRWKPGRPHYWYHGVFVYGPAPWSPPPPPGHPRASVPERTVSHAGDLTLGVRGASYTSGYKNGAPYSDLGLGVAARYRFVDALGLEVQWVYHDDSWSQGTQRIEQPLSASLQLFAVPWARVNPYLVAGLTVTQRNVQDKVGPTFVEENRAAIGPHLGLGLDINLSEHSSLTLDGRYLAYANLDPNDAARAGALQGNLGVNFSF
jgi:hypothetical protein